MPFEADQTRSHRQNLRHCRDQRGHAESGRPRSWLTTVHSRELDTMWLMAERVSFASTSGPILAGLIDLPEGAQRRVQHRCGAGPVAGVDPAARNDICAACDRSVHARVPLPRSSNCCAPALFSAMLMVLATTRCHGQQPIVFTIKRLLSQREELPRPARESYLSK
jgi:hypothetical protein